jgi:hypothetical protein
MHRSSRGLAASAALALAGALLAPGLAVATGPGDPITGHATISFATNTIPLGVASPIAVTLSEHNLNRAITLIATVALPSGFTAADPPNASGCTGFNGSAGSTNLGFTLDAHGVTDANCTETVDVVASTPGGAIVSVDAHDNSAGITPSANTRVDVVAPATIGAAFGASTLEVGGSTSLTFTITNPNAAPVYPTLAGQAAPNLVDPGTLTGVGFSDTLPAGLVVATPNGLSSTCVGTPSANAGSVTVSLVGGVLAIGASCTVVVNVTAVASGTQQDSTGQVSSTEGGQGAASGTSLTVNGAAPTATPVPTAITPALTPMPTATATPPSGPVGPSGELILLGLSLGLAAALFAIRCRRQVRRS